jgi:hypothetical protein
MATTKRKPAGRGRKSSPAAKGPSRSRERPTLVAEPPLQQGLLEMATVGAQSLLWLTMVVAILAALAGAAFGIWSLRPVPVYLAERVKAGSPFAVTFWVENGSTWFPLSHLKIHCALARLETLEMPPVEADMSRIPERLEPGQSATFTCPFRGTSDDLDVALRTELYLRSEYDEPVFGAFRLTDTRGPLVLNTRLLPPRWTAKPGKD